MATAVMPERDTQPRPQAAPKALALTRTEVAGSLVVFVCWLGLFTGGILIDTKSFRQTITPAAAAEPSAKTSNPAQTPASEAPVPAAEAPAASKATTPAGTELLGAWLVVLTCYLPVNLAWICVTASALGAFGEQANLSRIPASRRAQLPSNPYVSATLRGFFVYLFLLSGLLLLDDAPFNAPSQGQYVRLAGFLSLFSFVVSYQPRLFNVLIVWAFHRIQVKEGDDPAHAAIARHAHHVTHSVHDEIYNLDEHVEISKPHTARELDGGGVR